MSIRAAKEGDVPAMLAIYSEFVLHTAVSFEYEVPTPEAFARRLREHMADYPWLVWEEDGAVLGYAYAGRAFERAAYAWNAEISCYLDVSVRGRGVGRRLYAAIEAILTAQGCRKVFAVVTSANAPSVAFHEALGYRRTAVFPQVGFKQGQWYDVIWLEKALQSLGAPAEFPKSWRTIENVTGYLSP